jgi:hypothetical protein
MDKRSWFLLEEDPAEWKLPDDLRARDALQGIDCGWVNQMLPFIRHYAKAGDTVFDPFCGFGTTLLAASLAGCHGIGMEIDAHRIEIAGERLARHKVYSPIIQGSLPDSRVPGPFDICITSVPYFGCRRNTNSDAGAQLYSQKSYAQYLEKMQDVFYAIKQALPNNGFCIVMVENIVFEQQQLPLAWDIARILNGLMLAREERIICYAKPRSDSARYLTQTDRSHEFALVFQKARMAICTDSAERELASLSAAGFVYGIVGSYAKWRLDSDSVSIPSDIDLKITDDQVQLDRLCHYLRGRGYMLSLWSGMVAGTISVECLREHHYLRAERIDSQGKRLKIDISL